MEVYGGGGHKLCALTDCNNMATSGMYMYTYGRWVEGRAICGGMILLSLGRSGGGDASDNSEQGGGNI